MRRASVILVALGCANLAAAQTGPREVSLFVQPSGYYSHSSGLDFDPGLGLGMGYVTSGRWSVGVDLSRRSAALVTNWTSEAALRYHFLRPGSQWRPYVGAGLHYDRATADTPALRDANHLGALLRGGGDLALADGLALRLDWKIVPLSLSGDSTFDVDHAASAGITWRF
jgi:hypothetical protein